VVDELAVLDGRITEALAALRRARMVAVGSPNSTTQSRADMAGRMLDALLDQRARAQLRAHADLLAGAAAGSRPDG
jgi:hypothetical protein